jgi:hypothetical protein
MSKSRYISINAYENAFQRPKYSSANGLTWDILTIRGKVQGTVKRTACKINGCSISTVTLSYSLCKSGPNSIAGICAILWAQSAGCGMKFHSCAA